MLPSIVSLILACALSAAQQAGAPKPEFDAGRHRTAYSGPGRDDPEPAGLKEVLIAYFGPPDPSHAEFGVMWLAAGMAVDEENAAGGCRGLPFRILPVWSENPWASGAARLAQAAYKEHVWAIVGSVDGATTHLAGTVVAKALVPLVSPGSTDKTVNLANVPWIFSCLPSDAPQSEAVVRTLAREPGPVAMLSADDHDSQLAMREYRSRMRDAAVVLAQHIEFRGAGSDLRDVAQRVAGAKPASALIIAGAVTGARLAVELKRAGFGGRLYAHSAAGRQVALDTAGAAAEGIRLPLLWEPSPEAQRFAAEFRRRYGREPDFAAAQTYDAVRLVAAAIRKAGLNRPRILDALEALSPWRGAAGLIRWDGLHRNTRPVTLGVIRGGLVSPTAPE